MTRVFKVNRFYVRVFSGILLLLLIMPPVITAMQFDIDDPDVLFSLGIFYIAFSPIIIMILLLIIYYSRGRISITGENIEYFFAGDRIVIQWDCISHFIYDYICVKNPRFNIDRYYLLYEAGNETVKIRFNRLLAKKELENREDFHTVNPSRKKAFKFKTYGLYLDRKECGTLVNYIRGYTEIEPVRKTGMF